MMGSVCIFANRGAPGRLLCKCAHEVHKMCTCAQDVHHLANQTSTHNDKRSISLTALRVLLEPPLPVPEGPVVFSRPLSLRAVGPAPRLPPPPHLARQGPGMLVAAVPRLEAAKGVKAHARWIPVVVEEVLRPARWALRDSGGGGGRMAIRSAAGVTTSS